MSLRFRSSDGTEQIIAGLTPGGDIEAGAVARRAGTFTRPAMAAGGYASVSITFAEPMPDADYDVILNMHGKVSHVITSKTAAGFGIFSWNLSSDALPESTDDDYTAIKTYTVQHDVANSEAIATIQQSIPAGAGAGNKLVTASQLTNITNPITSDVADIQDLIPVGASITNQLVTTSQASVDSALSSTSEHAVQNKVVKAAIDAKQDTLTFDNVPTAGSNNPVKSNGIKSAINDVETYVDDTATDIYEIMGENGAKNLLPNNGSDSHTATGITFTKNTDGTVTINGTATAYTLYNLFTNNVSFVVENKNGLVVSALQNDVTLRVKDSDGTWYGSSTREVIVPAGKNIVAGSIAVNNGTTLNNYIVGPMLRCISDTDPTYQPYAMTNQELTDKVGLIKDYSNILPHTEGGTPGAYTLNAGGTVWLYFDIDVPTGYKYGVILNEYYSFDNSTYFTGAAPFFYNKSVSPSTGVYAIAIKNFGSQPFILNKLNSLRIMWFK